MSAVLNPAGHPIGSVFYDLTESEKDAGLALGDLADPTREPGDIRRYGASGDGTTDDTAAIQRMFDACPDGGAVSFRPELYRLSAAVTVSGKTIHVDATGASFHIDANTSAFRFTNSVEIVALTADYEPGDLTIAVDELSAAPAPGTPFKIVSNGVDGANRDSGSSENQYRIGEWAVADDGSTATSIAIDRPLRFVEAVSPTSTAGDEETVDSYTTTLNARILVPATKTVTWKGGTIYYTDGQEATPWRSACFVLIGYIRPVVEGLRITRGYQHGISLFGCYRPVVRDASVSNLEDNTTQSQYGYAIADASEGTVVENLFAYNCRHAYTSAADTLAADSTDVSDLLRSGRVVGARIINCYGRGSNASGTIFDTHHDSEDVEFIDCYAEGGRGFGFAARGRNIKFIHPTVRTCVNGIQAFTEEQTGDDDDDLWVARKHPDYFTTVTVIDADIQCGDAPFRNSRATLRIAGKTQTRAATQRFMLAQGGQTFISGDVEFLQDTMLGAFDIAEQSGSAIIEIDNLTTSTGSTYSESVVQVEAGARVILDCRAAIAASNNLEAIDANSSAAFRNDGTVRILMSTAFSTLLSSLGTFVGSQQSRLSWMVDGAADNSITTNLSGRVLPAYAEDGTVVHVVGEHLNGDSLPAIWVGGVQRTAWLSNGGLDHSYSFALASALTPATLEANTENWAPSGISTTAVLRVSTDASRSLTGITGGRAGRVLILINVGANDLVLAHDSGSGTGNRFLLPNSTNLTLNPNDSVTLWWDSTSTSWRVIGAAT